MFGFGRSRRLIAEAQNDNYVHVPVLLNEAIDGLRIKPDGIYVDCTMGGAGHSKAIIDKLLLLIKMITLYQKVQKC